jgi:hypothetical protein
MAPAEWADTLILLHLYSVVLTQSLRGHCFFFKKSERKAQFFSICREERCDEFCSFHLLSQRVAWSQIHGRKISLRFLGIILRILRLEFSVYSVYITNQFQPTFAQGWGGGGVKSVSEVNVNSKEENSYDFWPNYVEEFGLWTVHEWTGLDWQPIHNQWGGGGGVM